MNSHKSKVITIDASRNADALQVQLKVASPSPMLDVRRVVELMRGRRDLSIPNDRELLKLFNKGWQIKMIHITGCLRKMKHTSKSCEAAWLLSSDRKLLKLTYYSPKFKNALSNNLRPSDVSFERIYKTKLYNILKN